MGAVPGGNGETSEETRYFITSLPCEAKRFAKAVRAHWGIENGLHCVLDVTFGEDASRVRKGHAAENLSIARRISQSVLKAMQVPHDAKPRPDGGYRPMPTTPYRKASIKTKRLRCLVHPRTSFSKHCGHFDAFALEGRPCKR